MRFLRSAVVARRFIRGVNRSYFSFFITKKDQLVNFWRTLNIPQRGYFVATSLAILVLFNLDNKSGAEVLFVIALLLAVMSIMIEFWPKFLVIWHHLLGKTFIVIFYGIMANFALASAAGLVNEVAGVSSSALPYSHNMALILNIPAWFILTTMLALVVIQLSVPFYLVLLLLLKPFGLHGIWHTKQYRFVFTTAVVRYLWCTCLLVSIIVMSINSGFLNKTTPILGTVVEGYLVGHKLAQSPEKPSESSAAKSIKVNSAAVENSQVNSEQVNIHQAKNTAQSTELELTTVADNPSALVEVTIEDDEFSNEVYQKSMALELMLKRVLAEFIFQYEADNYSRCKHPQGTRLIELNDYQLLVIKQDELQPVGYSFEVIACQSPGISLPMQSSN